LREIREPRSSKTSWNMNNRLRNKRNYKMLPRLRMTWPQQTKLWLTERKWIDFKMS